MEEPAQSLERANPLMSEGGVPIDLVNTSWLDNVMAYLDSEDLLAIKRILEDVLQKKLNKLDLKVSNFITREEFYKRMNEILEAARTPKFRSF